MSTISKGKCYKCDECEENDAKFYIGSKKNVEALLCDSRYCIEQYREKYDLCHHEMERLLKHLT